MVIKVDISAAQQLETRGDDLDDGLDYNLDLVASENEADSDLEDIGDIEGPTNGDEIISKPVMSTEAHQGKKRKQKDNKLQDKKRIKMEMDIEQKKNLSQETSTEVIADFVNQKIRQKNPDLSTLELAELYFTKADIRSTSDYNDQTRNLDNLSKFIINKFKNMLPSTKPKKTKGKKSKNEETEASDPTQEERKFVAIVSMSALRACDIHRATKDIAGSSLKLINKNKIDVDLKLVKTTRSRVLCCTPGRLIKVLNNEDQELKKSEIKIIIVDNTYLDQKKQNIWDIKETTQALKELTREGSKIYLY